MKLYVLMQAEIISGMYDDTCDTRCLGLFSTLKEAQEASGEKGWEKSKQYENSWFVKDVWIRIDLIVFEPKP